MLIADMLLLLALDPLSGRLRARQAGDQRVLKAALMLELVVLRELQLEDGQLVLQGEFPDYHRLVEEVHRRLRSHCPASAVDLLRMRSIAPGGLASELLGSMADRDVLHRDGKRRWWWFGQRDYPVRSMQARKDAMAAVEQACAEGARELRGLALLLLLDRTGLAERLFDPALVKRIKARLARLQPALAAEAGIAAADQPAIAALWAICDALPAGWR